jgi:hypothetical protein
MFHFICGITGVYVAAENQQITPVCSGRIQYTLKELALKFRSKLGVGGKTETEFAAAVIHRRTEMKDPAPAFEIRVCRIDHYCPELIFGVRLQIFKEKFVQ